MGTEPHEPKGLKLLPEHIQFFEFLNELVASKKDHAVRSL